MIRVLHPRWCLLLAMLGACANGPAVDVALVTDPNIADPQTLLEQLRSVRLVIDTPDGLYPLGASRVLNDSVRIVDVDNDGQAELLGEVGISALGRLPVIRVERGGLAAQSIELRLDGVGDAAESIAAGGLQGLRFDGPQRVEVPFNLRAAFRPPQVQQVLPANGETLNAGQLVSVLVIFTKRMDADILRRPGVMRLVRVVGDREDVVATETPAVQHGPVIDWPTTVELRLLSALVPGVYRIRVTTDAQDTNRRALDQVPLQAGNQPFASQFVISTEIGQATVACGPNACPKVCQAGGPSCSAKTTCSDGRCLPSSCPAACPAGMTCDATARVCRFDCRAHGSYGGCTTGACDPTTGLCR